VYPSFLFFATLYNDLILLKGDAINLVGHVLMLINKAHVLWVLEMSTKANPEKAG
jgi:hypothetical protein